jgi:hypothetical protein
MGFFFNKQFDGQMRAAWGYAWSMRGVSEERVSDFLYVV